MGSADLPQSFYRNIRMDRWVVLKGHPITSPSALRKLSLLFLTGLEAEYDILNRTEVVRYLREGIWPPVHMNGDLRKVLRLAYECGYKVKVTGQDGS